MALSTISGGSIETVDRIRKNANSYISRQMYIAALVCLLAWILLIIAFASPYWLSSYKYTYSSFVRLGLWDFCFRDFRHPYFQYDEKFDGCHWVYSSRYHNIRDWLQPGIFIAIGIAFILEVVTGTPPEQLSLAFNPPFPLFLAITVFGAMAFNRSWLLYPQFNHLDWSYYVAIASLLFHCAAALLLCLEMFRAHNRRRKQNNLVYNMDNRSPVHFGQASYETRPMMAEVQQQSVPVRQQPYFTQV
ncbi:uncharacterized protein B4U79_01739 [Dinothrombium tinctorium]|uniref:Uncharacterized protein n=1 Tax=Dinothrombium tinctorium TaxID=1965070 RepID=A0A3S3NXR5_9ACAR|nr:uncharacterized protein B4U79_09818 [Dinothrombium tinctorium]RWS10390.1 uncharacterized protein B4U79_01953 [Dinothrombium tinctorium]RWS11231.1 uncharacterized protein B4U79_01739 [Dinothrombium tinctorium]